MIAQVVTESWVAAVTQIAVTVGLVATIILQVMAKSKADAEAKNRKAAEELAAKNAKMEAELAAYRAAKLADKVEDVAIKTEEVKTAVADNTTKTETIVNLAETGKASVEGKLDEIVKAVNGVPKP